ncbi:hypothetical protein [Gordonia jinhuaensis]|uniref:hypothetical protein n=1 Tax=Gordonia jinhuaensis TaxID=1517702 RepID=UPI00166ED057|nr:hypothetical protein [Gordonia jinhuaensis]
MSAVAITIIIVTVVVAILIVAGAAWYALDSDRRIRRFASSTDVVPGRPSSAPQSWTHSTEPEALLHQRLRYAIASVHENPTVSGDESASVARDQLDDAVVALDDQLVELAGNRDAPDYDTDLHRADAKVATLERLPGRIWGVSAQEAERDIVAVTATLRSDGDVPHPPAPDKD